MDSIPDFSGCAGLPDYERHTHCELVNYGQECAVF